MLWVFICTVHLTVCPYDITCAFLEWIYTLELLECHGTPCSKQERYLKFKWLQRDSNPKPLGKLAKWLNSTVLILTYLHDAFSCMSLLCHECVLIPLQSHDLLCLFNSIWIKWHFRFVCPVLYFKQISIGCQRWTFHAVCNTT